MTPVFMGIDFGACPSKTVIAPIPPGARVLHEGKIINLSAYRYRKARAEAWEQMKRWLSEHAS
jgi:hypothetical protein